MVVHHAGPGIHDCASSPGPQLQPVPAPMGSIEGTASSPARRGLLLLARSVLIARWQSNQVPWIHGCAFVQPLFADVCIRSPHVCRRLHTSGPGIHGCASSTGPQLQPVPAPMESIEGTASSPGPQLQPSPLASIEGIASSPARRGLLLLARSVLITRWHSNQVPWDPSKELHRVPSRGDCCCCCWPGQR